MTTQLEHVRPGPPSPLTSAEQRASYADQGYLVFPDLLSSAELADLRAALASVMSEADGLTETNDKFSVTQTSDGN